MSNGITDIERGLGAPFGLSFEPVSDFDDEAIGLRVVDQTALVKTVSAVMAWPNAMTKARVQGDLKTDPRLPTRRLETSHWPTENERLLYLRTWLELTYFPKGTIDTDVIFAAMLEYETRRQRPDLVVSNPTTREQGERLRTLRVSKRVEVDRDKAEREEQEFLREVEKILAMERLDAQTRIMRVDLRRSPIYTHGAVSGALGLKTYAPPFMNFLNLALDFFPVIGQIKGVAESIIGYDLTRRKLETWERGLGGFLSILPGARGVFRAGKEGIKALAWGGAQAAKRGMKAIDVYRTAKVASRVTEAELLAARVTGRTVGPKTAHAVEKIIDLLAEMQGQSRRSWRAASGTIDNGIATSRIAVGVSDTAAKVPGKVIAATKASKAVVAQLANAGVSPRAIAELERVGIQFSGKLLGALADSKTAVDFLNRFHASPGFAELVKDLAVSASKREGALFAMAYAVEKVNPALAKFEVGAGITKHVHTTERAARRVDITAGGTSYELKSWSMWTLERALRKPTQLVKDTTIFGREHVKWVFNSAKITEKETVIALFKKAVESDPYLKVKWPQGEALDRALDGLIDMFPSAT